jgi:chromosome segregation ATPase
MKRMASVSVLMLAAALTASAQFEVAPDHFVDDNVSVAASTPAADRLQQEIAEQQAALQASKAMLQTGEEKVEQLRQEAISAGIQGDGAGPQISAYREEQTRFEVLRSSLASRITTAEATLVSLQDELAALGAPTSKPVVVASGNRARHPAGSVLLASR